MNLYTSYYKSPIGSVKLECDDVYLKSVVIEDDSFLQQECEHPILMEAKNQLDEYFTGSRKTFDLPLDQAGTNFQKKVWDLLYQLPYGKTISYTDLTKRYGDGKAIRAVAAANGRNKIWIIIPCHRVIGSNRSLTGYAGGLWRKKWLLEHEAKHFSGVMQFQF
ncbi:MAG TPA: methylated-DNA--[protein]-cysteine S-methyltransferase [Flavisolibacter sp.]|nr:methylated-DNA--[protein]-cysteine S-methyltransferase [Flavisolibacter sp.]